MAKEDYVMCVAHIMNKPILMEWQPKRICSNIQNYDSMLSLPPQHWFNTHYVL